MAGWGEGRGHCYVLTKSISIRRWADSGRLWSASWKRGLWVPILLELKFCIGSNYLYILVYFFNVNRIETYISPLVEELSCIPLQLLVPFVAHNGRTSTGQAFLSNVHMVAFHPLGPVATITAVNEACTFEEQGCSCHYRSFLKCLQKIFLNTNTLEKLSEH